MAKYFYVSNNTTDIPEHVYSVSSILRISSLESDSDPGTYIKLADDKGFSVKGHLLDVLAMLDVEAQYIQLEPYESSSDNLSFTFI